MCFIISPVFIIFSYSGIITLCLLYLWDSFVLITHILFPLILRVYFSQKHKDWKHLEAEDVYFEGSESRIRGICTQLYPAGSESLTWPGICRSVTAETLNSRSGSTTSVVIVSVRSKRTRWAGCHAVWSRSHWPGSCGRSRTWNVWWTRPLWCVQVLPPLLWGYWCAVTAIPCGGRCGEVQKLAHRSQVCLLSPLEPELLGSCSTLQ